MSLCEDKVDGPRADELEEQPVIHHSLSISEQSRLNAQIRSAVSPPLVSLASLAWWEQFSQLLSQFDRRLMPVVCCLYVLSYLDRGNIGNAKTAGAQKDLSLSDSQWAWVLNTFYICYVCFEWTTVLWKILPAHIYVSALCVL